MAEFHEALLDRLDIDYIEYTGTTEQSGRSTGKNVQTLAGSLLKNVGSAVMTRQELAETRTY